MAARLLVDAGPDLRAQALRTTSGASTRILFTHGHADHILGLDESGATTSLQQRPMVCYGDARTLADIRRTFGTSSIRTTPTRRRAARRSSCSRSSGRSASGGRKCSRCQLLHGTRPILGFRLGGFAYLTDCSAIPDESWPLLEGLDVLVLDALRDRAAPDALLAAEAIDAARRIGAAAHLLHPHVPRSLACDDLAPPAAGDGAGL